MVSSISFCKFCQKLHDQLINRLWVVWCHFLETCQFSLSSNLVFISVHFLFTATVNKGKIHGFNAIRLSYLFMKLCSILKIPPTVTESGNKHLPPELEEFTSVFHQYSANNQESSNMDVSVWTNNAKKVSCQHLVFLWGFKSGFTAGTLKSALRASHDIFSGDFDVKFVDKSCAVVVFWQPGLSKDFHDVMNSEEISGGLKELVSHGMRVTCYETYRIMCKLGLWEMDLAESLERALESSHCDTEINSDRKPSEIHWRMTM